MLYRNYCEFYNFNGISADSFENNINLHVTDVLLSFEFGFFYFYIIYFIIARINNDTFKIYNSKMIPYISEFRILAQLCKKNESMVLPPMLLDSHQR